jgi:putative two-component system response regulator
MPSIDETGISKGEILAVDDMPALLGLLSELLTGAGYSVRQAPSGELALWTAQMRPPEIILLDVRMPGMNGMEVCRQLKADPATTDVPVIFLSALNESVDKVQGLALGAVDYITKPYQPEEVLARVNTHITLARYRKALEAERANLEQHVRERTADLEAVAESLRASEREMSELQEALIVAMASLAETRDNETGAHIMRTQHYVLALARELARHPKYAEILTEEMIDLLFKTAPLHDIGKVGIPDHILLKPGKLTGEEFEIMKTHTTLGRNIIAATGKRLHTSNQFLAIAEKTTLSHHEKWNGRGYPHGLSGDEIPVSARLMAIADVYDAIISRRVYKVAMGHDTAVEIIREGRGAHFDPEMVDAFLRITETFRGIAEEYVDDQPFSD